MFTDKIYTQLIIVCGRPGVGKTTYASVLAKHKNAVLLDIDTVTEPLVQAGLKLAGLDQDDRDSELFKATFRDPIHQSLLAIANQNLAFQDVIIVAPFSKEVQDPKWLANLKCSVWPNVDIHYLVCNDSILRNRLKKRGNPRDAAKLSQWQEYTSSYKVTLPCFEHLLIDTSAKGDKSDQ